jgi:hypothetical protein
LYPPAGNPAFPALFADEEYTPIQRAFADNNSIYCRDGKMKRTLRIILFIGTLVLIAALVGFVALKIGEFRLSGEQSASAEYAILRNAVSPITSEQEFGDQFVRDRLKSLYSASAHLLAVQVLDRNGLVLWKIPDDSPYFASPATSPGSVFHAPGMSTVIYMTPLPDGMKLMALYSILSQKDIANILLVPIIILAAWIILLVILQIVFKGKPVEVAKTEPVPAKTVEPPMAEEIETQPEEPSGHEEQQKTAGHIEGNAEENIERNIGENVGEAAPEEASMEAAELDEEIEEILQEEELPPEEAPFAAVPAPENPELKPGAEAVIPSQPEMPPEKEVLPVREEPPQRKIISEETSPAESEYDFEEAEFVAPPEKTEETPEPEAFPSSLSLDMLKRTLETELQRSQETSLLLIQCMFSGESDPSALALGVTIRDYFASESLVFELAKGCYAAVLPGVDAGSGLKLAVDLDDVLTTTASLYKDLSEEPPFYFGISALYDRTISPERLYKEALAALQKAHESGSRILAFKPASPTA